MADEMPTAAKVMIFLLKLPLFNEQSLLINFQLTNQANINDERN